jgi:hypothetical protein
LYKKEQFKVWLLITNNTIWKFFLKIS